MDMDEDRAFGWSQPGMVFGGLGPEDAAGGQAIKGLGPCGMSQAPTAARLGLPGASAGYRMPLKTFEQETDDATTVPGGCEGVELSVLEGERRT